MMVLTSASTAGVADPPGPERPLAALRVAITVDDLPANGDLLPGVTRMDTVRRLIRTFESNRVPHPYGFANRFEGLEDVVREWLAAGYPLGNHTYNHLDLGPCHRARVRRRRREDGPGVADPRL